MTTVSPSDLLQRLYGRFSTRWALFQFELWCSRIAAMENVSFRNDLFGAFLRAGERHAAKNRLARIYRYIKALIRARRPDSQEASPSKGESPRLRSDRLIATINQLSDERRVLLALYMQGITYAQVAARYGISEEEALQALANVLHQLLQDAHDDGRA